MNKRLPRWGRFHAERSYALLVLAPLALAGLYALGVSLEVAGILISLDICLYALGVTVLLSVAAFGRIREMECRISGAFDQIGIFVLLTCFFLLPIFEAIRLNVTNDAFLFGFVPWADAENYIEGGWQLLVDGVLSDWHQRRPINASVMELRLLLAGFNLHGVVLLNSLMLAAVAAYSAWELPKHFNITATILFVLVIFGYAQPYLPSNLSAMLGLSLGLLAFGALLRSARLGSVWLFSLGLSLLSFALNARAGNYFVLPAVWLWGVIYLGQGWHTRVTIGALGAFALASGFLYSLLLIDVFGSGDVMTYNANFADTLYGLAVGGKGWTYAHQTFPDLYAHADAATWAATLFKLSFQEILQHPLRFVGVYFGAMEEAFVSLLGGPRPRTLNGGQPVFVFADIFTILTLIGFAGLLRYAFDRRNALILLVLAGFFSSVPFIWQDGGLRVLAATVPFAWLVLPVGFAMAGEFFAGGGRQALRNILSSRAPPAAGGTHTLLTVPTACLVGVALIPFVLAGKFRNLSATPTATASCSSGTEYYGFYRDRLLYVMRVHPGEGQIHDSISDVTYGELQSTLGSMHLTAMFKEFKGPYTIAGVILGRKTNRDVRTVVWRGELKDFANKSEWRLCVSEVSQNLQRNSHHVYQVVSEQ